MSRRHGTRAKYANDGCRCTPCRVAARNYDRSRRNRKDPWLLWSFVADDTWMEGGACRTAQVPTAAFFPTRGEPAALQAALEVCEGCPDLVREECLEFALRHRVDGVWGGTSQRQRRRMKATVA